MKKNVSICFRTSKEMRESLEKLAKEERRSLSSAIEAIIYEFLKDRKKFKTVKKEKRQFMRKKVAIPAYVYEMEAGTKKLQVGTIKDISLGGVCIALPKSFQRETTFHHPTSRFGTLFTLPEDVQPIDMQCTLQRVLDANGDIHIGATFADSDFQGYQKLVNYLI